MTKDLIFVSLILSAFLFGYLLDKRSVINFMPYPKPKPFIVEFTNDCYVNDDFEHDILTSRETEKLLKTLSERKLK